MKKVLMCLLSVMLTAVMAFGFSACELFDGCGEEKTYVIQYTYGGQTYQVTVTKGQPYVFETVPEKAGYEFLGLFDAETGGDKYVSESGASVGTFSGKQGMVLYPQFKACEYTLILDYQGGDVTGERQITAQYDSPLPALPKNVTLAHNVFVGWFTEENCGGIKVADKDGLVPLVSVVNYENFNLDTGIINLYAGFEAELFTVNLNFGAGTKSESVKVGYGTSVEGIAYSTRVNGQGVLSWSKSEGGTVFTGNITEDTDLYALNFAPVIELDGNGVDLAPYVASAGSTIAIPEPQKPLSDFLYWETENGKKFTTTVMPEESFKLKAVWQPKLVFDVNGGSAVTDISVAAGEKVTLPSPTKDGYIFAGWYTQGKKLYTSTTMPSEGVALKAGWYKANTKKLVYKSGDDYVAVGNTTYSTVDLSEENPEKITMRVTVKLHFWADHYSTATPILGFDGYNDLLVGFHSLKTLSSAYMLSEMLRLPHEKVRGYREYNLTQNLVVEGNIFYISMENAGTYNSVKVKDYYVEISYPDTTNLYL